MRFYFSRRGIRNIVLSAACVFSLIYSQGVMAQSAFDDPQIRMTQDSVAGKGDLIAVEPEILAGRIPLGSSAQVVVRFRNESGRPIEFRDISLYPSSNVSAEVAVNQCATEALGATAECAVVLSIKGLQPGNWRTEMLFRHTGRSRLVTAKLSGVFDLADPTVKLVTDLEFVPSPVDFGTLNASRPIVQSITIRNVTSTPIEIKDIYVDAPSQSGYDLRTDCKTLNAGQACIASILWSPIIAGPSSGFLVLEHSGSSAVSNVELKGMFSPDKAERANIFPNSLPGKGVLVSSETEVDFGSDVDAQSAITVSLVNVGDTDLTLSSIQLAGSDNGLKLLQNGCSGNMTLSPTEACPLTVSWAPTKIGAVIDDIQVRHDGARGILIVPVRGTATAAISVDSKPIFITNDSGRSVSASAEASERSSSTSARSSTLDGYVVTSHSSSHAIIRGPAGSRIVSDGKKAIIGGVEWNISVVDTGVRLTNGQTAVLLVFDRSLSNVSVTSTNSTGNSSSSASTGTVGGQQ